MSTDWFNLILTVIVLAGIIVSYLMKYLSPNYKPAPKLPEPKNTVPIVSHEPPDGMTPCLAAFILNRGYYDGIIEILVADAAVKNLLRVKDSASYGAMIIETLVSSESFDVLPETEKEALFILLGDNFLPGRIFRFIPKELSDLQRVNDFLSSRLEQESYLYRNSLGDLLGFKKYLEVGEQTRLPGATPEEAPARFIGTRENALEYLPYALAFGLRNQWAKIVGSEVMEGCCGVLVRQEKSREVTEADLYDL